MKWVTRLSAFAGGLVLALSVHFVWRWHQPLSLCDLDRRGDYYGGKVVRLRVLVSNDVSIGGPFSGTPNISAFSPCLGSDDWPGAGVDLDPGQLTLLRESRHLWR